MKKPIIAVLTEITEKDEKEPSFKNVHSFCEELNELVAKKDGFFYVFSLKGISKQGVKGFYYDDGLWRKENLPFPDVVYNRIHSRKSEASQVFRSFIELCNDLNIKVFNQRFLSKWEVHCWLETKKNLQPFLPETKLYRESELLRMIQHYSELYIKPINGSQGRGIFWIKNQNNQYQLTYSEKDQLTYERFGDFYELKKALDRKIRNIPYLIQQGLPLLHDQGKRVDFRILCHQARIPEWSVSSVVARLSAENHFAANLALGGELLRPQRVLTSLFGKENTNLKITLLKELALESAQTISEFVPGLMIEVGIDLGINVEGNLWIIEINSKPSKNLGEQQTKIRPSARAIVDSCYNLISIDSEGEV